MSSRDKAERSLSREIEQLRERLRDAEEMRHAITRNEVDAFVVGIDGDNPQVRQMNEVWERYREVLEKVSEGAVTLSDRGAILYANEQFIAMVGSALPELFDVPLERYLPDGDHAKLLALLGCGIAGSSMETRLRRSNLEFLPVKLSVATFSEGFASLVVARLPQRLDPGAAEEALNAIRSGLVDAFVVGDGEVLTVSSAHRPLSVAMDHIGEGAATVSPDGVILYANQGLMSLLGRSRDQVLGADLKLFLEADAARLRQALDERQPWTAESTLRRSDDTTVHVLMTVAPIGDGENVCVVVSDLTDRKKHEVLSELDRRKTEFIATLSHELRDPLGAVRTALALLERSKDLTPSDRSTLQVIGRQTQQMTRMVDDLLDMNRIEQGMIELRRGPTDLRAVIEAALEGASPLVQQRGHAVVVQLPDKPVLVEGDLPRLCQAITNLIANAARYTPARGTITVTLECTGPASGPLECVICIQDTGIGISRDRLVTIFQPFIKGDPSSGQVSTGLGIGLTLSRRLIELHGGTLEARSEGVGSGAQMIVRLPGIQGGVGKQTILQ